MSNDESIDQNSQSNQSNTAESVTSDTNSDREVSHLEEITGENQHGEEDVSKEVLRLEIERLRERLQQLQKRYARSREADYQRTAIGLGAVGLIAIGAAVVVHELREILLSLGAIGVFGAVLTYYLIPERFVAADISAEIYRQQSKDREALVNTLGLSDQRVYVPLGSGRVRLFVPQFQNHTIPRKDELAEPLVVPENESGQGVLFKPTGQPLYESFIDSIPGEPDDPEETAEQLRDVLAEDLQLVNSIAVEGDKSAKKLTVTIEDSTFGPPDTIDNPVVSTIAVALSQSTEGPVVTEVVTATKNEKEHALIFRWDIYKPEN